VKWLVLAIVLTAFAVPRVSIKVSPAIIMAGGSARVTCTVPRAASNRGVTAVLENYRSMYDQLDGESARITHEFLFERIPCDIGDAMCILETSNEKPASVRQTIQVADCEP
jgi:hypothetical protein